MGEHLWVDTPRERFEEYMKYLAEHGFKVIAMRDLAQFVDPAVNVPDDPIAVMRRRLGASTRQTK